MYNLYGAFLDHSKLLIIVFHSELHWMVLSPPAPTVLAIKSFSPLIILFVLRVKLLTCAIFVGYCKQKFKSVCLDVTPFLIFCLQAANQTQVPSNCRRETLSK